MGSKIHAWPPPPQRFSLSIRLRCGTWAPGDEGANGMKDIKKHLHDFCRIMCQFAGETWNACKCFRNGVKLQMTAETEAWLRLKPWNRCWSSGRDTFCWRRSERAGLSVCHRGQTPAELPLADLLVTVLQGCLRCIEPQRGKTVSRRCTTFMSTQRSGTVDCIPNRYGVSLQPVKLQSWCWGAAFIRCLLAQHSLGCWKHGQCNRCFQLSLPTDPDYSNISALLNKRGH